MLGPAKRREVVEHVRGVLGPDRVSQRRACQVLGQCRSTQRREPAVPDDDHEPLDAAWVADRVRALGLAGQPVRLIVRQLDGVPLEERLREWLRELAARMGIKQNYLYRVLPSLEEEGKVAKQGRGWHPKSS